MSDKTAHKCLFTRNLQPESSIHIDEETILERLEDVVREFVSACSKAELVSIDDRYIEGSGSSKQPFVLATVECVGEPEDVLIKHHISIIGSASYATSGEFPIELLGPEYWVDPELSPNDVAKQREDSEESDSVIDKIADMLYDTFG